MAEYLGSSEQQKSRAYSPAVITQGGRTVWLAGQTATRDEQGNDIAGNFEAQVRTIFSLLDKTLKRGGGSLANMVTMTVFIVDPRHGDRFVEMRARLLPGWQLSRKRPDHGLQLRAAGHADRDPGRCRDRRLTLPMSFRGRARSVANPESRCKFRARVWIPGSRASRAPRNDNGEFSNGSARRSACPP